MENGYEVYMKDRTLLLKDQSGSLIAKVPMSCNRLFTLTLQQDVPMCLKACTQDFLWLWHLRFGHLNFEGLKLLKEKNMVNGIPFIDNPEQICEGCLYGKQSQKSFPKEATTRSLKPLKLVHTDI